MTHLATNEKSASRTGAAVLLVLDEAPEKVFDDLTWLASQICCAPMAAISLRGPRGQWLKSKIGLPNRDAVGESILFEETLSQPCVNVVVDVLLDSRLAKDPLATSDPKLRFYAGVPLITSDGVAVGTLSIMDRVPRQLTGEQVYGLQILARQVTGQIDWRNRKDRSSGERSREW